MPDADRGNLVQSLTNTFAQLRDNLEIAHQVPGRVRLRFAPGLMGILGGMSIPDFDIDDLLAVKGIVDTRLNPSAMSLIIEYDPHIIPDSFWPACLKVTDAELPGLIASLFPDEAPA